MSIALRFALRQPLRRCPGAKTSVPARKKKPAAAKPKRASSREETGPNLPLCRPRECDPAHKTAYRQAPLPQPTPPAAGRIAGTVRLPCPSASHAASLHDLIEKVPPDTIF